jgi:aryl-alcohol dehydrogenase-like predicted oxidoreductase
MDQTVPHPELYGIAYTTDEFNGMPYLWLGGSGLRVPRIGLGTWKFGFPETGDGARVNEKAAFAIFDRAIQLGVTLWDTANRYNEASGNSERVIGRWLKANPDQRRNVIIATKMFGGMDGRTPNHCRLSRANILESVYASLERVQADHIDLLYFHMHEPFTPVEESLCAIEDLVQRDLIRYFGVGGVSVDRIRLYQAAQAHLSIRCRIAAVENGFDIVHGETIAEQKGVLAYCARSGISYVAYSPLARGLLTDRYLDPAAAGPGDRLYDEGTLQKDASAPVMERVRKLAALAHAWGLELQQLTLAYMLTLPGMGPVIPGTSSVAQLASNAAAGVVELTEAQKMQVREIVGTF